MSGSAKSKVMDMISKRAAKIRNIKNKSKRNSTPVELVLNFFEQMEEIYTVASSADDFSIMSELAAQRLSDHMNILDRGVKMEVRWTDVDDWRDLRVIGVNIKWSAYYQKRFNAPPEECIDHTVLLLSDFDDET